MSRRHLTTTGATLLALSLLIACRTAPGHSGLPDAGLGDGSVGDAMALFDSGLPTDLARTPDAGSCTDPIACQAVECFPAATCGALDAAEYTQSNAYSPCGAVTSFSATYAKADCEDPDRSSSWELASPDCGLARVSGTMQAYCGPGSAVVVRVVLDAFLPASSAAGSAPTTYDLVGYGLDQGGSAALTEGWIHYARPWNSSQTMVSAVALQGFSGSPAQPRILFLATKDIDAGAGSRVSTSYVVATLSLKLDATALKAGGAIELE